MGTLLLAALLIAMGVIAKTSIAITVAAILVVGSLGFWLLLAIASIGILVSLEYDHEGEAFMSLLVMLAALQLFSGVDIIGFFRSDLRVLALLAMLYFVVGTLWSFFKWFLFVKDQRKAYDEDLAEWDKTGDKRSKPKPNVPQAKENKSRITAWMSFWPWSCFWFLINDPIRRAFRAIFDYLQTRYQMIADKAFSGT